MMTPSLVLASASPFRRALLENAGLVFTARAAEIDERALEKPLEEEGAVPEDVAMRLAEAKARDVARHFPEALVIGSDQTMSLGQRVYHKPKDMVEAGQHLLSLSGKTHRLNSADCPLARPMTILWRHVSSANMTSAHTDAGIRRSPSAACRRARPCPASAPTSWRVRASSCSTRSMVTISPSSVFRCCRCSQNFGNWERSMRDSRETFVNHAFVTGYPIKHSRSPLIHGYWLKQLGLDRQLPRARGEAGRFLGLHRSAEATAHPVFAAATSPSRTRKSPIGWQISPDELCLELGAANTLLARGRRRCMPPTPMATGSLPISTNGRPAGTDVRPRLCSVPVAPAAPIIQAVRDRGIKHHPCRQSHGGEGSGVVRPFRVRPCMRIRWSALNEVMTGAGLFINTTSLGMDGQRCTADRFHRHGQRVQWSPISSMSR